MLTQYFSRCWKEFNLPPRITGEPVKKECSRMIAFGPKLGTICTTFNVTCRQSMLSHSKYPKKADKLIIKWLNQQRLQKLSTAYQFIYEHPFFFLSHQQIGLDLFPLRWLGNLHTGAVHAYYKNFGHKWMGLVFSPWSIQLVPTC